MSLRTAFVATGTAIALMATGVAFAQAPAGSTGECKDGTYTTNATKRGACARHKGVKTWYEGQAATKPEMAPKAARETKAEKAAEKAAATKAGGTSAGAAGAGAMGAAAPAPTMRAAPSTSAAPTKTSTKFERPATAVAGGGPGKVWVNSSSNVYHCMNDEWYGKTKAGEYMSEADAKAKGVRAAHGKACS